VLYVARAVHGQCPQFSRSLLWSDLRVCAGLAGFPGPKLEFGRGGVRVHRRAQQHPEKWIDAGAYPQMARRLIIVKFCSVCCDVQVTATAERADLRAAGRSGRFLDSVFVFGKRDGAQVRACVRAWRRPP
jgi:hypothetical protein